MFFCWGRVVVKFRSPFRRRETLLPRQPCAIQCSKHNLISRLRKARKRNDSKIQRGDTPVPFARSCGPSLWESAMLRIDKQGNRSPEGAGRCCDLFFPVPGFDPALVQFRTPSGWPFSPETLSLAFCSVHPYAAVTFLGGRRQASGAVLAKNGMAKLLETGCIENQRDVWRMILGVGQLQKAGRPMEPRAP